MRITRSTCIAIYLLIISFIVYVEANKYTYVSISEALEWLHPGDTIIISKGDIDNPKTLNIDSSLSTLGKYIDYNITMCFQDYQETWCMTQPVELFSMCLSNITFSQITLVNLNNVTLPLYWLTILAA